MALTPWEHVALVEGTVTPPGHEPKTLSAFPHASNVHPPNRRLRIAPYTLTEHFAHARAYANSLAQYLAQSLACHSGLSLWFPIANDL